jgi:superfamily I DNA/RNA helicase
MNSYTELWKNDQNLERRLFFVGVTRSRENLYISYSSEKPHYLVQDFPKNSLQLRSCDDVQTNSSDTEDDGFLF